MSNSYYIQAISRVFRSTPAKRDAHQRVRHLLEDLSGDRAFLGTLLRRHVAAKGSLNRKHYPVVGIDVEINPDYHLVANCWIPLPDAGTGSVDQGDSSSWNDAGSVFPRVSPAKRKARSKYSTKRRSTYRSPPAPTSRDSFFAAQSEFQYLVPARAPLKEEVSRAAH